MPEIKAVVLAAGRGERFGSDTPKPLAKFFGRSLIDYLLDSLQREGIEDIIVVYSDNRVKEHLGDKSKTVFNPYIERGSGYSLLLGAEAVGGGPFLLLMSDHLFDRRIISKLLDSSPEITTLCVDREFSGKNLSEATKVMVQGSKILEIGKGLRQYNALDTGIFFCNREVLEVAKGFQGRFSISDVMSKLSKRGQLAACDVTGFFWRDIDTQEELQRAEREILNTLVKPSDGLISKHINRRISIPISRVLVKTPITPDQISILSFFLGLFSAVLFALHYTFYGGLMAQISSIIDGCDGEVARIRGIESKFGAYFDSILDRYADIAILAGMMAISPEKLWHVGCAAILGSYSISYSVSRLETLAGRRFIGGIEGLMTRDMRIFIIMIGGMLNQILPTLLLIAVITNLVVAYRIIIARKVMAHES
jgi:CDP-L-myo-inositol myo-inositolphosphotransferase